MTSFALGYFPWVRRKPAGAAFARGHPSHQFSCCAVMQGCGQRSMLGGGLRGLAAAECYSACDARYAFPCCRRGCVDFSPARPNHLGGVSVRVGPRLAPPGANT